MEVAVRRYFELEHDIIIPKASIKSIPLRWEGKVMERVDKFYEQITSSSEHHGDSDGDNSWKDAIKNADIVLWATHSQGAPVSALLIKRLLSEGILQTQKQHICMLAMAGISHGPFPSLKDHLFYFEADAARELFEFMDSECTISIQYRDSMVFLLQEQVKVVFVGSMDDQVVPLYSAIMSGISHPNILRAIFIDGQLYSENDFLIRLITFAIRLLNAGLSDHGFLTHISEVLAGNFYAWNGGHSTLYEETDVFMLPMDFLFKTSPLGPFRIKSVVQQLQEKTFQGVKARLNPFQAKHNLNPFYLPWTLRGIWDDPQILENEELNRELKSIQSLFEQWSPTTARLKGIKFRLEPLRARL
ncbi:hypothetical protein BDF20DRAFT_815383 [Mycotypha africana]|uniref:uncharacterized protein n=1 Tax=Mycotypha africana TaxID=64632 RepID=UPI002301E517|nr:uncharacterized protein BDF20DRAFT_815383 [Mycotypha africana]KAI8988532.1 hypothetical protein BDF20DRAFT_815383 [Mycotypha africana]